MTDSIAVIHVARAPYTGVWTVMRELANWQQSRGYSVSLGLLIPNNWPSEYRLQLARMQRAGIGLMSSPSPQVFGTAAFAFHQLFNPVGKWAREFETQRAIRVVHFHNAWLSGALIPTDLGKLRAVATYHGIQAQRTLAVQPLRRRIHASWAKRLLVKGARLTSVDQSNTHVAQDLFGLPHDSFSVIPNGTQAAPAGHKGGPRLNDSSKPLTVGHVGVLDEGKGWRITAGAVEKLREGGQSIQLLIAGRGPDEDDVRRWCETRTNYARYIGFSENPRADVFPKLDVMALPSLSEGLPMAALEAFAFGVPVVATRVGGIPELIIHGCNGVLIERSVASLSAALRILCVPSAHAAMAASAQETHRARYSLNAMGEGYEQVYTHA